MSGSLDGGSGTSAPGADVDQAGQGGCGCRMSPGGKDGDLHAGATGQRRWADHYDNVVRKLAGWQRIDLAEQSQAHGVLPARGILVPEADAGRRAIGAELALEPGRVLQLADPT